MPKNKVKTHKAFVKRIKITGRKKIMHKRTMQDHFNAKQSGTDRINKRREKEIHFTKKKKLVKKSGIKF